MLVFHAKGLALRIGPEGLRTFQKPARNYVPDRRRSEPAFEDRTIFLAHAKDGAALPKKEAPLRVIVPDETREARWIRQVVALKVIAVGSE